MLGTWAYLSDLKAHAFLSVLLDSCQPDPGTKASLETLTALLTSGILGPQGQGIGYLWSNAVPLSFPGSLYRVQQVPRIEEREGNF